MSINKQSLYYLLAKADLTYLGHIYKDGNFFLLNCQQINDIRIITLEFVYLEFDNSILEEIRLNNQIIEVNTSVSF